VYTTVAIQHSHDWHAHAYSSWRRVFPGLLYIKHTRCSFIHAALFNMTFKTFSHYTTNWPIIHRSYTLNLWRQCAKWGPHCSRAKNSSPYFLLTKIYIKKRVTRCVFTIIAVVTTVQPGGITSNSLFKTTPLTRTCFIKAPSTLKGCGLTNIIITVFLIMHTVTY